MPNVHLDVLLRRNRNLNGVLRIEVDGTPVREFMVLGRGSRGGGDTQFLENGNTPTGEYDGNTFLSTEGQSQRSYGRWGKMVLKPLSGNALIAQDLFHRRELRIHGGDLGTWYGTGSHAKSNQLRPTHGCLRLSNADMRQLYEALMDAGVDFRQE